MFLNCINLTPNAIFLVILRGSTHPNGHGQGAEPLAKCGCTLWSSPAILWNEGDELLHGSLWRQ